jgi:hypothetical protein
MIVKCVQECFDSVRCRHYFPGDQDDIAPMSPVAQHFEGWPPGTEIYCKIRGTKTTPARDGVKVVPGVRPVDPAPAAPPPVTHEDHPCPWCEFKGKNEASLRTHQRSCKSKPVEPGAPPPFGEAE